MMGDFDALRRPSFFSGQLLTADDLSLEQNYVRGKQKRHNRTLHGFGIVSGLRVSLAGGSIVVGSGLALDCEGNELVVSTGHQPSPLNAAGDHAYVNISYCETQEAEAPPPGSAQVTVESIKIHCSPENRNRNHRHLRGRWLACGLAHDLTIAKLRRDKTGWRVDRRYRPPLVK